MKINLYVRDVFWQGVEVGDFFYSPVFRHSAGPLPVNNFQRFQEVIGCELRFHNADFRYQPDTSDRLKFVCDDQRVTIYSKNILVYVDK